MNNEQNIEVEYIKIDKDIDYSQLKRQSRAHDVQQILDEYGFSYEKEKTFNDLKMKRMLRYDYYVDSLNCLIEFDGEQHYYEIDYFKDSKDAHLKRYASDNMKSDYALENNINLIRIPYWSDISQIRVKIDRLIGNKQLYLNDKIQKYLQAFIQTLDLNYIEMNKIYDNYEDMLKKLKVNSKLSYPTFRKYLIVTYNLDYKEIINKNNDWYEIYSQLDDNEYEDYKNQYKKYNIDFNYLIQKQIDELFNQNQLKCQYILKEILYIHFLRKYHFNSEDISFRGYVKYLTKIIKTKPYIIDNGSRTSINALNNRNQSYFNISNHNIDKYKSLTYYKNLNYAN